MRCLPVHTWVTKIFCGAGIASGIITTLSSTEKQGALEAEQLWQSRAGLFMAALCCALPGQPQHPKAPRKHLNLPGKHRKSNPSLRWWSEVFKIVVEAGCYICLLYFILSDKCRSLGYLHSTSGRMKAIYGKLSSPMSLSFQEVETQQNISL